MQIKRFEADDMTDALRKVKREFGDDAVILSAKEVRPGGFFGAWRRTRVEITAAADYPLDEAADGRPEAEPASLPVEDRTDTDRVTLTAPALSFSPLLPPDRSTAQQPAATGATAGQRRRPRFPVVAASPIETATATLSEDAGRTVTAGRRRARHETDAWVADPFYRNGEERRIIALVGPSGSGKSTTVAKLAGHCCLVEKRPSALISLDRFRMGGTALLEKAAAILGLPFAVVHDADQLKSAIDDRAEAEVILIDTPGVTGADRHMLNEIRGLLRSVNPDETHLVLNATVRQKVLNAAVDAFADVGVDRLLFTHLDEDACHPVVADLIEERRLPCAFTCDGADSFDHLQVATVDGLNQLSGRPAFAPDQVTAIPLRDRRGGSTPPHADEGVQFVANRNSELFHHATCKSVKRINVENITAFDSMEQAMAEGFKPCRACCDVDTIRRTAMGGGRGPRMRAI